MEGLVDPATAVAEQLRTMELTLTDSGSSSSSSGGAQRQQMDAQGIAPFPQLKVRGVSAQGERPGRAVCSQGPRQALQDHAGPPACGAACPCTRPVGAGEWLGLSGGPTGHHLQAH